MKEFTVAISEAEEKALLVYMVDIQEWIDNAIHNRARVAIDRVVKENTDRQPGKLLAAQKEDMIQTMVLETAKERTERMIKESLE